MTKPKILFLNGPPGSGKDLCGSILRRDREDKVARVEFVDPPKDAVCSLMGISRVWLEAHKDEMFYGDHKAHSYREIVIAMSEQFTKPLFGEAFLSKTLIRTIEELQHFGVEAFVVSSGFPSEAVSIIETFERENCAIARVYRANHDFSGDSRAYWEPRDDKLRCFDISNNASGEALTTQLNQEILPWLLTEGN